METYVLKENVLTDDLIHFPEDGKIFKGNYIAIVESHTFLNSQNDSKKVIRFRSENKLQEFLTKNYPSYIHL